MSAQLTRIEIGIMFERESARLAHIWQSKKNSLNFTHGITNGELGLISVCIAFLRYF